VIAENLSRLRERISVAAQRAGRQAGEITLVAISKRKPAGDIVAAYKAGQRNFGENYIQEFQEKSTQLPDLPGVVFHFTGKLQSNKTASAAAIFDVIQTVESERIARRLNDADRKLDIFLEVKVSAEESKSGIGEEGIESLRRFVESCDNLRLRGLMCMPPWSEDPESARPFFRRLRQLAEQHNLPELSMGMSNDFEVAIEEGATLIRVGTAIFGKRV
jgi:pyridoxal phosphate enzyme (YggS family)